MLLLVLLLMLRVIRLLLHHHLLLLLAPHHRGKFAPQLCDRLEFLAHENRLFNLAIECVRVGHDLAQRLGNVCDESLSLLDEEGRAAAGCWWCCSILRVCVIGPVPCISRWMD